MDQTTLLTPEQYEETRARVNAHEAWVDTRRGKNGWASYRPEEVPDGCQVSNEERSAVEVHEFMTNPPVRYFAYVKGYDNKREHWGGCGNDLRPAQQGELTTWTGDKLGTVTFGARYVLPNGSARVPIRVVAINGRRYHGTYFVSSGDYCRLRACKGG